MNKEKTIVIFQKGNSKRVFKEDAKPVLINLTAVHNRKVAITIIITITISIHSAIFITHKETITTLTRRRKLIHTIKIAIMIVLAIAKILTTTAPKATEPTLILQNPSKNMQ